MTTIPGWTPNENAILSYQTTPPWVFSEPVSFVYNPVLNSAYAKLPTPPSTFQGETAVMFNTPIGSDHFVEATIAAIGPVTPQINSNCGIATRMSIDPVTGLISAYLFFLRHDGGVSLAFEVDVIPGQGFGASSDFQRNDIPGTTPRFDVPYTVGSVMRMEVVGNMITAFMDGVVVYGPVSGTLPGAPFGVTKLTAPNVGMEAYPVDEPLVSRFQLTNFRCGPLPSGTILNPSLPQATNGVVVFEGTRSLKMQAVNGGFLDVVGARAINSSVNAVVPGGIYVVQGAAATDGTSPAQIWMTFMDSNNAVLLDVKASTTSTIWKVISAIAIAPIGAVSMFVQVVCQTSTVGATAWFDAITCQGPFIISTLASDNFNRANQNPIGAPWIGVSAWQLPELFNGSMALSNATGAFNVALYDNGVIWPPDQYSQASIKNLIHNAGYLSLVLRCDDAGQNFYYIDLDASGISGGVGGIGISTPLNLQKIVGGVLQPVHQFGPVVPQIGDVFRAQIIGNIISVFQNGNLIFSFTDTVPLTSGRPGLQLQTGSVTNNVDDVAWDNWSGGAMVTAASISPLITLATDNFNRVQNPINTNWIPLGIPGFVMGQADGANYIGQAGAATDMLYSGNGITWGPDQFSQATLKTLNPGKGYAGLYVRSSVGASPFGYQFILDGVFGGSQGIGAPTGAKLANGLAYIVSIVIVPQSGDVFRLEAIGNRIAVYQNGNEIISAIDTTTTSGGMPGILASPTGPGAVAADVAWDDWSAGSLPLMVTGSGKVMSAKGAGRID